MRMKLSARAGLHGAGHRGDAVEGVDEADERREFQSEVREGAEDAAMAEAFDDFEHDGASVANGERLESVGAIEACEAAGIKEADVDFRCAVAVLNPVAAGDVIWMAPFCPQWFVAMGKTPASYLYYKDVNRAAV